MLRSFKVVSNIQIQSAAPELQIQIRGGAGLAAVVVAWIQRGSATALGSDKRQRRQWRVEGFDGLVDRFFFFCFFNLMSEIGN